MHVEKIMVVNLRVSASCMTCRMAKQALYSIAMAELITTRSSFQCKVVGQKLSTPQPMANSTKIAVLCQNTVDIHMTDLCTLCVCVCTL